MSVRIINIFSYSSNRKYVLFSSFSIDRVISQFVDPRLMQLAYDWRARAAAGIAETNRAAGTVVSVGAGPGHPAVVVAWPAFVVVACAAVESFADIERSVEVGCHEGTVALVHPSRPLLRLEPVN